MGNLFISGQDHDEHDTCLCAALQTIQEAGVTLNPDKCEFSRKSITFLGQVIDEHGLSADPSKTQAVIDMERPKNITELRRFMGMANQLGKFLPNLRNTPSQFVHSSALEHDGWGVQHRRMPLMQSSQSWQPLPHQHCMTQPSPQRSLLMPLHTDWVPYYFSNMQFANRGGPSTC